MNVHQISVFIVVLGLIVSACGKKGVEQPAERRVPELPEYDAAACKVQPKEGGNAAYDFLGQTRVVTEDTFGKRYDRADLDAVLAASPVETALYVLKMGISAFRIPRLSERGCPTYYVLDAAPAELQNEWRKIAGSGGEGQLAGIYFESCFAECPEREIVNPTIMVAESADRWTLVHEMMHHNFNAQRKGDLSLDTTVRIRAETQAGIVEVEHLYNLYKQNKMIEDLRRLASTVNSLVEWLHKLLLQTSFEEMALESLLLDEFTSGRLQFVAPSSAQSAVWYVSYSREDGMRRFESFRELFQFMTTEATERGLQDVLDQVNATRATIRHIDSMTRDIEESARKKIGQISSPRLSHSGDFSAPVILPRIEPWREREAHLEHESHVQELEGYDALLEFDRGMADVNARLRK